MLASDIVITIPGMREGTLSQQSFIIAVSLMYLTVSSMVARFFYNDIPLTSHEPADLLRAPG